MRKIMFRGKSVETNEWVYGVYILEKYSNTPYICYFEYGTFVTLKQIEVHPETIGEFTGFTDKNGKEIFTGDIVIGKTRRIQYDKFVGEAIFGHRDFYLRYPARYTTDGYCWHAMDSVAGDPALGWRVEDGLPYDYEIIGNIYDNPEKLNEEVKW